MQFERREGGKSMLFRTSTVVLSLIALAFLALAPQGAYAGLVGVWLLDEASGDVAVDSSGNGLDGQIVGDPQRVNGIFGGALQFDGIDDYVEVPFNELLNIPHMTSMAWASAPDDQDRAIIHRWAPPAYTLEFFQTKTTLVIMTAIGFNFNQPDVTIITGEWFHIAGTYDGEKLIAYQNGEVVNEVGHSEDIVAGEGVLRFAARTDNDGGRFNGIIDEIAIFDEALTQAQIQDFMNNGLMPGAAIEPMHKLTTTWAAIRAR